MGTYVRLVDFYNQQAKEEAFLQVVNKKNKDIKFTAYSEKFKKIPGVPLAYWASDKFTLIYLDNATIFDKCEIKQGLATCNNSLFIRDWVEIEFLNLNLNCSNREEARYSGAKWFPYNKGGGFRKWYGNNYCVVNWKNDGEDIHKYNKIPKTFQGAPVRAKPYYFRKGITYCLISSTAFSARNVSYGYIFDVGGSMVFTDDDLHLYITGLLCSKISSYTLNIINPTLNFQVGDIGKIALKISKENKCKIDGLSLENITMSKTDWDSFETSWDFKKHPLI